MISEASKSPTGQVQLAPSELVCIFGTRFAAKHGKTDASVPAHVPGKQEDYDLLAHKTLAAAFLADEQAGSLRLETGTKKALFGLRKVPVLNAVATDTPPPFAPDSWESLIYRRLLKSTDRTASILALVSVPKSAKATREVFNTAFKGMTDRGFTVATEKTMMKIHYTEWSLAGGADAIAAQQPIDPIESSLQQAEQTRPDVWKLLFSAIKEGLAVCDVRNEGSSDW